jgi:sugar lactone lactonase YvrE
LCLIAVGAGFAFHAVSLDAQTVYQPYAFTTFAGLAGSGTADGTGAAARFNRPGGVVVAGNGNIIVADTYNHTIRQVTAGGVVTTIAGASGIYGNTDGSLSAARFYVPNAIAAAPDGTLYVTDEGNGTIRKITVSGTVSTIARGYSRPDGIAADSNGNVFFSERYANRIIKIDQAGVSSIFAGSVTGSAGATDGAGTAARFSQPIGLAADGAGNVYVADFQNCTIRKITPGGTVTTLAGVAGQLGRVDGAPSTARFGLPSGVAVDSNGNIFVADTYSQSIRKIDQNAGNVVTTLAGSGASGSIDGPGPIATFLQPKAVAVDGAGNIYVADEGNHEIRKITPGGSVTTLAGRATEGSTDGAGPGARFNQPSALVFDSAGNLYVADTANNVIRKIAPDGAVSTFAGTAGNQGTADGTGGAARFNGPQGLTIDIAGNIYVADTYNDTIRKITPSAVVSTIAGTAQSAGSADGLGAAARFHFPGGVAVASNGNIYVADGYNHTIRKIAPDRTVTTVAGSAGLSGSSDGTGSAARFNNPQGIAVDQSGNIYVSDTDNSTIRLVAPGGVVTTYAGRPGEPGGFGQALDGPRDSARFSSPVGITTDPGGYVYVVDYYNNTVRRIDAAGATTIAGNGTLSGSADGIGPAALFFGPRGIAVDPAGIVFVADAKNHCIRRGLAEPVITSPTFATAVVGLPFVYQFETLSATSTTVGALPPGLSYNSTLQAIVGTPGAAGTYQISLSAGNATDTVSETLFLQVLATAPNTLTITSSTSATGRVGQAFKFQVITDGGSANTRVSALGLPAGVTIDPVTGVISGTPLAAGSFYIPLTVTDGVMTFKSTLQLTFVVDPRIPIILNSATIFLTTGQSVSYTITALSSAGPSDPTIFTLLGTLPPGLSFDAATGTISGTYTGALLKNAQFVPLQPNLSGGILASVQLFGTNSHGTGTYPLLFLAAPSGAVNISTRLLVGTGENVLIGGFIITGNAQKVVIVRAIGPSTGIPGALQDPTLELHDGAGHVIANDNWRTSQEQTIKDTTVPPTDDREAAIVIGLDPGNYTAIVRGKDGATGISLVEIYDLGTASLDSSANAKLANIATRGFVQEDNNVMIGGFIVQRTNTTIIARAIGPSLIPFGVAGALQDTTLELHDGSGSLIVSNDDWRTTQEQQIKDTSVPPKDDRESAIVATLNPGNYTAIVRGKNNSSGVALVEVYALK